MKKIYLAHPISLMSADEVFSYYDSMKDLLVSYNYDVLSPMIGKDKLRTEKDFRSEGYGDPLTSNHAIFGRDTWMVSQSDIILCDFRGAKTASIGCSMELAIGSWLNKHIIIVLEPSSVHDHAFIREAADVIYDNIDDALQYLKLLS